MIKSILLSLLFILSLDARDNPFSPQTITTQPKLIIPIPIKKLLTPPKVVVKKTEIKTIPIAKTYPIKKPVIVQKPKPITKKKTVIKKPKKRKVKKYLKKISKSKLLYKGRFAKIKLMGNSIQILTKDFMLKHLKLNSPHRLVVDFERFDVVKPFSKKVYNKRVKALRVGHHDYFYRATLTLNKNYRYKIIKKSYGYLITLY